MVLIICVVITFIFLIIAIYAFVNKRPDCVYSGGEVYPEEIKDIKNYNRAISGIYLFCTALFLITMVIVRVHEIAGAICMVACVFISLISILVMYKHIYIKYSADGQYHKPHYN